ncbi:MAG: tRNA-binding protein [spirochete symbiont of Stewartia floridana]|nr:MAG: tRNA-binding protein [spirochete symbiont of Stewartia floridana]
MDMIEWKDFEAVELRTGTILSVEDFPASHKPAWIITADFGSQAGIRKTSARITDLYDKDSLLGRQVIGVVNIPPRQIGPVRSEFLLTGFYRDDGAVVIAIPERPVSNGAKLA